MDRRTFLRSTGLVSTAALMPQFLRAMPFSGSDNGKVFVVVQLGGGNDGLNTVIPYANDTYHRLRPKLAVPAEKVLRLSDSIGLNPGMGALRGLYDEGLVSIVQGVGYPDPDRSHFRSMDIWHTASASGDYLETGWLGRYLDAHAKAPHQVIEFGGQLSLANKGEHVKAIALTDPARFHAATQEPYFAKLAQVAHADDHTQLGYLQRTMAETYQSAAYINEKLQPNNSTVAWPKGPLAQQLRHVARFIRSGMMTRVYYTSISGFDTHVNQAGPHQKNLGAASDALSAFMKDMEQAGRANDVLVMVFSEFGRRVKQNASNGTDHGTAGPMFLLGKGLKKPGLLGQQPSLDAPDENGDLRFAVDFRSIYASVLEHWLDVPAPAIMGRPFELFAGV